LTPALTPDFSVGSLSGNVNSQQLAAAGSQEATALYREVASMCAKSSISRHVGKPSRRYDFWRFGRVVNGRLSRSIIRMQREFPDRDRMYRDVQLTERGLHDLLMEIETLMSYRQPRLPR
jgi:hypothetical protein